jgi:hypothetical protein
MHGPFLAGANVQERTDTLCDHARRGPRFDTAREEYYTAARWSNQLCTLDASSFGGGSTTR